MDNFVTTGTTFPKNIYIKKSVKKEKNIQVDKFQQTNTVKILQESFFPSN